MRRLGTWIWRPAAFAFALTHGPGLVALPFALEAVGPRRALAALSMSPTTEPTLSIVRSLGAGGFDACWLLPATGVAAFLLVAVTVTATWVWPEARWWHGILLPTSATNAWFALQFATGSR